MMKRKVEESLNYEDERKKVRTDRPGPSRTLHLRSLPSEATENDIASVAIPFGTITYMVVTRKTAQALIQMENKEVAETMFNYYQEHPPYIRNKKCFFQYSIHTSLQAPNSSMHPEAENAVHIANKACESMRREDAGPVLRVIIDDWNHEKISNLHFYKIFYHYGILRKVVFYVNKGLFQGFIEYTNTDSAKVAKSVINGMCVFPRCCAMKISFSNRKTLEISREDEMIRDYDKHPVESYELKQIHTDNNSGGNMPRHRESSRSSRDPMDTLAALQPLLSQAVDYPEDAMPLLRSLAPAIRGLLNSSHEYRDMDMDNYDRGANGSSHSKYGERISPLLIVSNLNEAKVNADALFKLFGCYGDVVRVKIMFNRKNTALVEFVSDAHAQRALQYLNGVNLYGKPIHANFSKHDRISHRVIVPDGSDTTNEDILFKDFSDNKLHRFKKVSSRNQVNIYEPSRVLHVAGLIDEVTEEDMEAIFQDHGFHPRKIKIITPNNKKMALVEMTTVESAVEALIEMHDFDLCGSHLRVSFSKAGPLN